VLQAGRDKVAALALLAKIQGLVRDRVEVSGPGGGPIETVVLTPAERARRIEAVMRARDPLRLAPPSPPLSTSSSTSPTSSPPAPPTTSPSPPDNGGPAR
jgi:hypothetical protein